MKQILLAALISFAFCLPTNAQMFFPRWGYRTDPCPNGQCKSPEKKETPPKEEEPPPKPKENPTEEVEALPVLSVARSRFFAETVEIADACDEILDRLVERYGKPRVWKPFSIYFQRYRGDGVAGYTLYQGGAVVRVVCFEPLTSAKGGTLDHELTHAFFFYFLNSNFDLLLNEGLAQNSEYRRRESLRQTVYRRYNNREFLDFDQLYGLNRYDGKLLIYHEGFSVVDFLVARGGSLWLAAFMDELVRTNDINATLYRYYGYRNLTEAQDAWYDYIERGQNRHAVESVR